MSSQQTNAESNAYPLEIVRRDSQGRAVMEQDFEFGLTKREYFAAAVIQGLSSKPNIADSIYSLAEIAVKQADALLAELERREEKGK